MEYPVEHHRTTPDSDLLTFTELDDVRASLDPGAMGVLPIQVGMECCPAFIAVADSGALLVLLDPGQIVSELLMMQRSRTRAIADVVRPRPHR